MLDSITVVPLAAEAVNPDALAAIDEQNDAIIRLQQQNFPVIDYHVERIVLEGDVPSPINPEPGCRFAGRCRLCEERCHKEMPELRDMGNGHYVACHLV